MTSRSTRPSSAVTNRGCAAGGPEARKPWSRSPSSVAATGAGRTRLARIPDAGRRSLHEFITTHIAPGSIVLTDAWPPYGTIDRLGYGHKATSIRASTENASELLPRVHRVAALLKRWLDGTHQGAVQPEQLDYYLDEFTFRFNRRDSRVRGLLFYRLLHQAVRTEPHPYAILVAGKPIRPAMPITTRKRRHKM